MTTNEILNELRKGSMINNLAKKGLISPSLLFWHDIYLHFDLLIKMGYESGEAVRMTATKFKVTKKTIYCAINKIK